jgi:phosphoribosylformylglycinamidine synthase PurS subunit
MKARMIVTLRQGVLDPAGEAVCSSLTQLGFDSVKAVRLGKVIELDLDEISKEEALAKLEAMGNQLLANTVIECFEIELL